MECGMTNALNNHLAIEEAAEMKSTEIDRLTMLIEEEITDGEHDEALTEFFFEKATDGMAKHQIINELAYKLANERYAQAAH